MTDHLYQTEEWHPKEGGPVRIADMGDVWRFHASRFMERHAEHFARIYTVRSAMLGMLGGASAFDDDFEDAVVQPLHWVRRLPLYQALIKGLPTGGPELDSLRERARHWSTCPTRLSLELTCTCTPAPVVGPPSPAAIEYMTKVWFGDDPEWTT